MQVSEMEKKGVVVAAGLEVHATVPAFEFEDRSARGSSHHFMQTA